MRSGKLITVIIPAFNSRSTICETVQSIVSSTSLPLQIIVSDDASTDDTCTLVQHLGVLYPFVTLLRHGKNTGPGAARNRAFPRVSGDFVMFFDADDLMIKGAIDRMVEASLATNSDIVIGKYVMRSTDPNDDGRMLPHDERIWTQVMNGTSTRTFSTEDRYQVLGLVNFPWNRLYKSEILQDARFYFPEYMIHEDIYPHWYSLLYAHNVCLHSVLIAEHFYHFDSTQMTNLFDDSRFNVFDVLELVEELFSNDCVLRARYYLRFTAFKLDLFKWIEWRFLPERLPEMQQKVSHSFCNLLESEFSELASYDPFLAGEVLDVVERGVGHLRTPRHKSTISGEALRELSRRFAAATAKQGILMNVAAENSGSGKTLPEPKR
jgi:glycosyltransferase involved in cell wall biosynthesis